jgi:hypothetical protein
MRTGIIKHLLIFFFIFSILEKTGVSMLALVVDNNKEIAERLVENEEEDDSTAPSENKEALKEYWVFQPHWQLPVPCRVIERLAYVDEENNHHLAYFPAVPTPPPDFSV